MWDSPGHNGLVPFSAKSAVSRGSRIRVLEQTGSRGIWTQNQDHRRTSLQCCLFECSALHGVWAKRSGFSGGAGVPFELIPLFWAEFSMRFPYFWQKFWIDDSVTGTTVYRFGIDNRFSPQRKQHVSVSRSIAHIDPYLHVTWFPLFRSRTVYPLIRQF